MSARPYQRRHLRRLVSAYDRGAKGTLLVSATGTGKTFDAVSAAQAIQNLTGYSSLFLAPTIETLDQGHRAFLKVYAPEEIGIMHGKLHDVDRKHKVILTTPHTLRESARYESFVKTFPQGVGAIFNDEAHHFLAPQTMKLIEVLRNHGPAAMPIGLTATPERSDERHMLDLYPDLSSAYDLMDAMHDAYLPDLHPHTIRTGVSLANVHVRRDYDARELEMAVNVKQRNDRAVQAYLEYGNNEPAIAFCAGVHHAEALAERFREQGINAMAIHGDLTDTQRRAIVDGFRTGGLKVITGYNVPLEGLDVDARLGLWLRPTKLEHVYMQGVGRLLRPKSEIQHMLGELHDVSDRRALLERTKGFATVIELRDDDPRSVRRPTVGIATIMGLPGNLELSGEPIRLTSQRMDLIASRMPERARLANSDKTIHVLADMAEAYFGAPEVPMLPLALQKSRATHGIAWHPHGPRRYAATLLLNRGGRTREDALVLSAYGDIWAVEHARHGVRTPLYTARTFEEAIDRGARYHRDHHVLDRNLDEYRADRTPADLARLGAPFEITIDNRTLSLREAILTELAISPNRYRDRAALWERAPLGAPRVVGDHAIAHASLLKVDLRKQQELLQSASAREAAARSKEQPEQTQAQEQTRPSRGAAQQR